MWTGGSGGDVNGEGKEGAGILTAKVVKTVTGQQYNSMGAVTENEVQLEVGWDDGD